MEDQDRISIPTYKRKKRLRNKSNLQEEKPTQSTSPKKAKAQTKKIKVSSKKVAVNQNFVLVSTPVQPKAATQVSKERKFLPIIMRALTKWERISQIVKQQRVTTLSARICQLGIRI